MVIKCEEVWREVSNYLDDELDPVLHAAIREHVAGCKHCAAVLDGTRNVIQLYGDERMLEVPLGFGYRLQERLSRQRQDENIATTRRGFMGWMVAAAAAVLIVGGLEVVRSGTRSPAQRSQLAQPANRIPPDMMVVVSEDGKLFHVAGCTFIHEKNKLREVTAAEAMKEGYAPCVRCMKKYLLT